MFSVLIKGALSGLYIALPTGPVGALVIERSLKSGFRSGFRAGLGSAIAHVILLGSVVFGLSAIADFLSNNESTLRIVGALVLCLFGLRLLLKKHIPTDVTVETHHKAGEIASGFLLTIVNPVHVASYTAILAVANGVVGTSLSALFLGAFFVAKLLAWAFIAGIVSKYRDHVTPHIRLMMYHLIGAVIVGAGILLLI